VPKQIGRKFELTDDLIDTILTLNTLCAKEGKEFGAAMCTKDSLPPIKLNPGTTCVGNECEISLSTSSCDTAEVKGGDYHAHPTSGSSNASPGDLLMVLWRTYKYGLHIGCRSGVFDNTLTCEYSHSNRKALDREIGELYVGLNKQYEEYIEPFYDEWRRTKVCPRMSSEMRRAYDDIEKSARHLLASVKIPLNDLQKARGDTISKTWPGACPICGSATKAPMVTCGRSACISDAYARHILP
jgi:hypothetical protein